MLFRSMSAGQIGRPPSSSLHFLLDFFDMPLHRKKWCVFWNARRICCPKTTFFSDKTSCTVSGKKIKRKNVVLGRVLAYFSYTNQGQSDLYLTKFQKQGVKPAPPHVISRMAGREKKIGAFLPISDMPVQKRPSKIFETKNIFIFGAGPNFGRSQKRGFAL